ncbi:hypothetical protein ABW19_dt0200777 [Dactylella cylindrospora]|nr:hypothetical protein ABW19_dt0200777 [Dactylella cylindrospora]
MPPGQALPGALPTHSYNLFRNERVLTELRSTLLENISKQEETLRRLDRENYMLDREVKIRQEIRAGMKRMEELRTAVLQEIRTLAESQQRPKEVMDGDAMQIDGDNSLLAAIPFAYPTPPQTQPNTTSEPEQATTMTSPPQLERVIRVVHRRTPAFLRDDRPSPPPPSTPRARTRRLGNRRAAATAPRAPGQAYQGGGRIPRSVPTGRVRGLEMDPEEEEMLKGVRKKLRFH